MCVCSAGCWRAARRCCSVGVTLDWVASWMQASIWRRGARHGGAFAFRTMSDLSDPGPRTSDLGPLYIGYREWSDTRSCCQRSFAGSVLQAHTAMEGAHKRQRQTSDLLVGDEGEAGEKRQRVQRGVGASGRRGQATQIRAASGKGIYLLNERIGYSPCLRSERRYRANPNGFSLQVTLSMVRGC